MFRELFLFNPTTGKNETIEQQNQENQDLYYAVCYAIDKLDTLAEPDADVAEAMDTFRSFIINRHDADWVGYTVSNQYLYDSAHFALRSALRLTITVLR